LVFQAATASHNDALVTHGGRVLSVVGVGTDLDGAVTKAYAGASAIQFAGKQLRGDIAAVPQLA
jgi:phosphoribosylamine---glycine ligase